MPPLECLTEFPPCLFAVVAHILFWLALQPLETLDCLQDTTVLFQNITDRPVDKEPRNLELIRKSVNTQLQTTAYIAYLGSGT